MGSCVCAGACIDDDEEATGVVDDAVVVIIRLLVEVAVIMEPERDDSSPCGILLELASILRFS